MTREEAIARIKDHIEVHHIKEDRAIKIVQALNMAIEALERTKWHYLSKGEYPTEDGRYFVARYDDVTKTCFTDILWFENKCWWNRQHTGDYAVYAWMPLLIPPKEER